MASATGAAALLRRLTPPRGPTAGRNSAAVGYGSLAAALRNFEARRRRDDDEEEEG